MRRPTEPRPTAERARRALLAARVLSPRPVVTDDVEGCIARGVTVEALPHGRANAASREVSARITNTSGVPLGGVWIGLEIWSSERPVAPERGSIRPLTAIPGALMPGETMTGTDHTIMDERATRPDRAAPEPEPRLSVENVADAEMDGARRHPAMGRWSGEISDALRRD